MKIAIPSRHGRLIALCGLSAALHLLVLDVIVRHGAGNPTAPPDTSAPLAVRLGPAVAAVATGHASPATSPVPVAPAPRLSPVPMPAAAAGARTAGPQSPEKM